MIRLLLKRFWPFLLFVFITVIFFWQFFLKGLIPLPADLTTGGYYPWLDYKWGNIVGVIVKNPILSDSISVFYPIKTLAFDLIKEGQFPFWNQGMFGGYPLFANFQMGLLFPSVLFYFIFSNPVAWSLQVILQPLLSMVFMYLFLRHLRLNKIPSVFGAISYGFGGFSMIWLEWNTLAATSSFLPLLLLLEDKFISSKEKRWLILFSVSLGFQILAGYPQVVMFTVVSIFLWFLVKFTCAKDALLLALFGLLGIGLTAIVLLPGFEQFFISQRKIEPVTASFLYLPWQNFITFFSPDFFGSDSTRNFWGQGENTLMTNYSGLVTLILASIGVWVNLKRKFQSFIKNRNILLLITFLVLALLISLPNPVAKLFYDLGLWGGKAASTTRVAFLINFSLSGLASFGIEYLLKRDWVKLYRVSLICLSIVLGVALGCFSAKTYLLKSLPINFDQHFFSNSLVTIRNMQVGINNLILPMILIIVCLAISQLMRIKRIKIEYLQVLLIVLATLELFRFGWKFNAFSPQKYIFPSTPVTNFLKMHQGERIIGGDVIPQNMWLPYGVESVNGYDAVYPFTWAKFVAVLNSQEDVKPAGRIAGVDNINSNLFDLSATKYVLVLKIDKDRKVSENGLIAYKWRSENFKKVFEDKSVVVLEDSASMPRAFLISNVVSSSANDSIKKLLSPNFSYRNQAVVVGNYQLNEGKDNFIPVSYKEISNNHTQVLTNSFSHSFLVVLDSYYPSWKALIDGVETPIYQTDFAFRGVDVPPGTHQIDFVYYPKSFYLGLIVSFLAVLLLILIAFFPRKSYGKFYTP